MTMPKRPRLTRLFWQALACLALLVFLGLPLGAKADGIVQGFSENGDLQPGWIVALSPKAASTVEAAPASNSNRIYGVVINPSDSSLTLRSSGAQVYVATGGNFPVLVSLVNGKIKAGDYISMSNTDGIGAKAKATEPTILGRATQAFDGQHGVLVGSGNNAIGRILANISPQHNPETKGQSSIPSPLKQAADSIAGHTVSVARVWAAVATFFLASAIGVIILMVGVRTGMTAIGRNPLSKHSILMGLFQVVAIAILIFIVGLFGVYLLLKL